MKNFIKNNKMMVVVVMVVAVVMMVVTCMVISFWHHKKGFVAGENPKLEDEGVEEVLVEDILIEETIEEEIKEEFFINVRFKDGNYRRIRTEVEPETVDKNLEDQLFIVFVDGKRELWDFCGDEIQGVKVEIIRKEVE